MLKRPNLEIFSILTKKCKNHTFFWSPPPNGHFPKNVPKKLLASNTAQNSGPKIEFLKGLPFGFLPKMACFHKHTMLTNTKYYLKIGRLAERKIGICMKCKIFAFSDFFTPCGSIFSKFDVSKTVINIICYVEKTKFGDFFNFDKKM